PGASTMIRMRSMLVALAFGSALAGCDFEVSNPGPTPDDFLDNPAAHQAVANGAALLLFDGLNTVAYTTAAVTREIFPAGSTSSFGISANQQVGLLLYNDEHADSWTSHQQSRYVAETGFGRFDAALDGQTAGY